MVIWHEASSSSSSQKPNKKQQYTFSQDVVTLKPTLYPTLRRGEKPKQQKETTALCCTKRRTFLTEPKDGKQTLLLLFVVLVWPHRYRSVLAPSLESKIEQTWYWSASDGHPASSSTSLLSESLCAFFFPPSVSSSEVHHTHTDTLNVDLYHRVPPLCLETALIKSSLCPSSTRFFFMPKFCLR